MKTQLEKKTRASVLDIGDGKICALIADVRSDGGMEILGVGTVKSRGVEKGLVTDLRSATDSMLTAIQEAEKMADTIVDSVLVGLSGRHLTATGWHGVTHIENPRAGAAPADVRRAIETSGLMPVTPDKEILDVVAQEFAVDGHRGIRNPVGMAGSRLEAFTQVIAGQSSCVRNVVKCLNNLDIEVNGLFLNSMAAAEATLHEDEKDLGAALADLGAGSTEIAVYKRGRFVRSQRLPIGGRHFDNDLAVLLSVSLEEAERLKIQHGHALGDGIDEGEPVWADLLGRSEKMQIYRGQICEILRPRVVELFSMIAADLEENSPTDGAPAILVLTGGGALLNGLCEAGRMLMNLHVRIAEPDMSGARPGTPAGPQYAAAVGLARWAWRREVLRRQTSESGPLLDKWTAKVARGFNNVFKFRQAW